MTKLKEVDPRQLNDRVERACAKLARIARGDTFFGGARALTIVKRLKAMGSKLPADAVVGDVYSRSNLSVGEWGAYECPECGSVHFGTTNAYACCGELGMEDESL